MGLLEDCSKFFGTGDLYSLFDITKDASDKKLKKAYHKLSLKVHPDKAEDNKKEEANRAFQIVSKAYYILSDKERRAIYDEQGVVDDEDVSQEKDWTMYWRGLFPKITLKDIEDFIKKYQGSLDEKEDLKKYYTRFEGDMLKLFEYIPGYDISDEARYRDILESMIADGIVEDFPAFHVKESKKNAAKRTKNAAKEAKEAETMRKEMGLDKEDDFDLSKAILQRQSDRSKNFDSLISSLEAKYARPKPTKKAKKK